jgi:uncharacterized cupredoxin-like copper-binding protein
MSHRRTRTIDRSRLIRSTFALCLVPGLALAGCGDDGSDTASATEGQAFCDAYLAVATDQGPDVDWENATDQEIGEAMGAYATAFEPKLDALVNAAPAEVADAVDTYTGTYQEILETGDDSAFDDEYLDAETAIVDAAIESCAVDVVDATAVDYGYEGVPDEVAAGRVGFRLVNEGADVHEAVILRRAEGDTTAALDIAAMSEEEQAELVEFVGVAFVAPGSEGAVLLDLSPGEYIVICNLPIGMTEVDAEVDGAPHHSVGMVAEFSVA